jgi:Tfp pilus assembly protein PilF
MNRIEMAVKEHRAYFVLGDGFVNADVEAKLKELNVPAVSLTDETTEYIKECNAENLAGAFSGNAILVLLSPSFGESKIDQLIQVVQNGQPRPQIFLIAKSYNRFSVPMRMMRWKFNQIKQSALPFLESIPVPEIKPEESKNAKKQNQSSQKIRGPIASFVGRTKDIANFNEKLSTLEKPVFLFGPEGIGKTWLVDHCLHQGTLKILPPLRFDPDFNTDAFLNYLAEIFAKNNDPALKDGLSAGKTRPTPSKIISIVKESLQKDGLETQALLVRGFEYLLNDSGQFYREGLLETLLINLFQSTSKLKLIFTSSQAPSSFTISEEQIIRLGGLAKEDVIPLFEAWQSPELSAEQADDILERTKGHPVSLRNIAIRLRNDGNTKILETEGFGSLSSVNDGNKLRKQLKKSIDSISKEELSNLERLALANTPIASKEMNEYGCSRTHRLSLVQKGLLEQTPDANTRRYYVHSLVFGLLRRQRVYNFEVMEELGSYFLEKAKEFNAKFSTSGADALFETLNIQQANALFLGARKRKRCWNSKLPFLDPLVQSARSLLFSKNKDKKESMLNVAKAQINDSLRKAPNHPDMLLLEIILAKKDKTMRSNIEKLFSTAKKKAATPELFVQEILYNQEKNLPQKSQISFEQALKSFSGHADLHYRQALFFMNQGQLEKASRALKSAIELAKTNPRYYSLLGELFTNSGSEMWEKASDAYRYSRSLYTKEPPTIHLVREAELLRARAMVNIEEQKELLQQAQTILADVLKIDSRSTKAQVALARVLLDLDQENTPEIVTKIEKLLAPALKRRDSSEAFIQKARVLIRQNKFTDVEANLNKAFKLSRKNHQLFTVRGEFYLVTGQPVLALQAFQKALDSCPKSAPEFAVNQRYLEQTSSLIASGANIDYSAVQEDDVSTLPVLEEHTSAAVIIRRQKEE